MKWTLENLPDQKGKTVLVTGANAGIGFETAQALAAKGARVILACRNSERGEAALAKIRKAHPQAQVELQLMDLTRLASVREAAEQIKQSLPQLDLLMFDNAGVMIPPASKPKRALNCKSASIFWAIFC